MSPFLAWPRNAGRTRRMHAQPAVQSWLPVEDVGGGVMVRRDGRPVAAVRVLPAPFALLSDRERQRRIKALREAVAALPGRSQWVSLPRPVDLDAHLVELDGRLASSAGPRRELLRGYVRYVRSLASGGLALEHRHYVLIPGEPAGPADDPRQRAAEFVAALARADLTAQVCGDAELWDLLFGFLHPLHTALERADPPVPAPRFVSDKEAPTDGCCAAPSSGPRLESHP